jgi:hypothetical protein
VAEAAVDVQERNSARLVVTKISHLALRHFIDEKSGGVVMSAPVKKNVTIRLCEANPPAFLSQTPTRIVVYLPG